MSSSVVCMFLQCRFAASVLAFVVFASGFVLALTYPSKASDRRCTYIIHAFRNNQACGNIGPNAKCHARTFSAQAEHKLSAAGCEPSCML